MWIDRSLGGLAVPATDRRKRRGFRWTWYPGKKHEGSPRAVFRLCLGRSENGCGFCTAGRPVKDFRCVWRGRIVCDEGW